MAEETSGTVSVMDIEQDSVTEMGTTEQDAQGSEMPAGAAGTEQDSESEMKELRAALKKANREAAERRRKLAEYEKAEQERAEAEMSELEKANKKLADAQVKADELEYQMRSTRIRHAVEMTAASMRFHDPADAFALADLESVEIDDDGNVVGVDKALKALAKAKPHLVKSEHAPNVNATARTNGTPGMSDTDIQEMAAIYGVRPDMLKRQLGGT